MFILNMEASNISSNSSEIPPTPPPTISMDSKSKSDNKEEDEEIFPGTPEGTPPQVQIDRYQQQQKDNNEGDNEGDDDEINKTLPVENFEPTTPTDSPPVAKFEPTTPTDSPPVAKIQPTTPPTDSPKNDWKPIVEDIDPNTGEIISRPRFNGPNESNIQYVYTNIDEDKQKKISKLDKSTQVNILKKLSTIIDKDGIKELENVDLDRLIDTEIEIKNKISDASINKIKQNLEKKQKKNKMLDLYSDTLETVKINLKFSEINKNIQKIIENKLKKKYENKCNVNGFVKNNSLKVINFSSGSLRGSNIEFTIVIQYKVCYPVEGTCVQCKVKNITKAGIRAEIEEFNQQTPLVIFIARDHHNTNDDFINIKEKELIDVKIIGKRFELNDNYISVIAELNSTEIN